jgi:uncharacterized membrane protein (UPF0127 family)
MNSKLKIGASFLIVATVIAGAIVTQREMRKNEVIVIAPQFQTAELTIGNQILTARIANTDKLRTQGLSGSPELGEGNAMLFVFDTSAIQSFWMKDMNYAIDIIWLDESKKIVAIKEHATPESFPEQFSPDTPALYVVEVSDGFVKENKVKVGDVVSFQLPL